MPRRLTVRYRHVHTSELRRIWRRLSRPATQEGRPAGERGRRPSPADHPCGDIVDQPYLAKAMANRATTVPKKFLKIVTSVSQIPKHLQRLFTSAGGRMTGGTIDRWTRTIYMVEPPGLSFHTRLEYALHECVHLFAHPHAPTQQACPQPCIGSFQDEFGTALVKASRRSSPKTSWTNRTSA